MTPAPSSAQSLLQLYRTGQTNPLAALDDALAHANSNAGGNVYLAQSAEWSRQQAAALEHGNLDQQPLWGLPISLKDCFDLEGFPTTCGSVFYRDENAVATKDSALAARLKALGAVLTGKTHMHQLAYGITGENRDFGDCLQPRNPAWLTGGSSSGAAASVQERSAIAAIATDTGGSVRVPAALCGLAGYRPSITVQSSLWEGGAHLAAAFDTIGWIYRALEDGPLLGHALFNLPYSTAPSTEGLRIGIPDDAFLHDCDPDVRRTLDLGIEQLTHAGANIQRFDATYWNDAYAIFAVVQADEAAAIHKGNFAHFEPRIAERLAWGAALSPEELAESKAQWHAFRDRTRALFATFEYLLLPCCPMSALFAGEDLGPARGRILRYTTPISLAGLPAVAIPGPAGGLQLIGAAGADAELLALSAAIGPIGPQH